MIVPTKELNDVIIATSNILQKINLIIYCFCIDHNIDYVSANTASRTSIIIVKKITLVLLNQVRAGLWPAHA